ncbi:protein-glutamate O-methyltransferase CheR [Xanthobacter dioxanivorans]|uniref:Protein-glutamate O-methyltransferase CheR n=1 Tax=Xanthobacter dioxanivorans TaxID=2528964 RepID=A0A974PPG8_9HYPH|nr:protein-glutamate O-methyltransferase CheR [Xanthobacter dioxanivorans]QRG07056.1 protein-glutamate O-methyltransferase CheR [Xanthobacter dioxanivorans]
MTSPQDEPPAGDGRAPGDPPGHDAADALALETIEVDLFVEALHRRYGYDFRDYSRASLTRRVRNLVTSLNLATISDLTTRLLHQPGRIAEVISGLSVPVSEFFRDPSVFLTLKEKVFPHLASYPQINVWQAGCAHGEEIYSLAILLSEAGLYERTRIFATDISKSALARAREGIFPLREAPDAARRYLAAGGAHSFSAYYHARYDLMKLDERLISRVTFAEHNLVTDGVFCEAHLILCRNVLIYFTTPLQDRVLARFAESLVRGGFLCVGTRENLEFSPARTQFQLVDANAQLYRLRTGAPGGPRNPVPEPFNPRRPER